MIPRNFDAYVKAKMGFARGSDLAQVPEAPGIYAWYLPLESAVDGGPIELLASLEGRFKRAAAVTETRADLGDLELRARRRGPTFDLSSTPALDGVQGALTSDDLERIGVLLLALSFLGPPIYVGMARGRYGLHSRLNQHVRGVLRDPELEATLRARSANATGDPDYLRRCVVAFACVDWLGPDVPVQRFLEHVLIQTFKPPQSRRG